MGVYDRNADGKIVEVEERDPLGLNRKEPGAKLDYGKMPVNTILSDFSNALEAVVQVGTFGASKYSLHGWLEVPDGIQRYSNAMMRHWLAIQKDGSTDPESGLRHRAHLAWNALAILELMIRQEHALTDMEGHTNG